MTNIGPFYHVEHRYGRVILTINTAHPFFEHLYEPLRKLGSVQAGDEDDGGEAPAAEVQDGPLVALELLLLSLGRAQAQVTAQNEDARKILEDAAAGVVRSLPRATDRISIGPPRSGTLPDRGFLALLQPERKALAYGSDRFIRTQRS